MASGFRIVIFSFFLALFFATALAQVCFDDTEQVIEQQHPKDSSNYYFVIHKDWGFKNKDGVKVNYEKGTSKLVLETGSVQTTQSELANKTNLVFSKYNSEENYETLTQKTQKTINGFTGFLIEFKDKQSSIPTSGESVVVWGEDSDGRKKYYVITFTARQANYDAEKALFEKAYNSFSLEPQQECVEEPPPEQPGDEDQGSDDGSGDDNPPADEPVDQPGPADDEPDSSNGSSGSNDQNTGYANVSDNKIFGFDPLIFFAGLGAIFLVVVFIVILLIIIAILAYLAFFRKK